jgi:hypothetical protein
LHEGFEDLAQIRCQAREENAGPTLVSQLHWLLRRMCARVCKRAWLDADAGVHHLDAQPARGRRRQRWCRRNKCRPISWGQDDVHAQLDSAPFRRKLARVAKHVGDYLQQARWVAQQRVRHRSIDAARQAQPRELIAPRGLQQHHAPRRLQHVAAQQQGLTQHRKVATGERARLQDIVDDFLHVVGGGVKQLKQ